MKVYQNIFPESKNSTRPEPGFEIPGSTPVYIISFMILCSFSSLAASVTSKYRDWQTDEQTQRLPHRESQDDGSFGLLPTANVF